MRYKEKKANNQTGQYQVILSSKTYVYQDNWPNISPSFGVPNSFFAYLLSKSQSGSKWGLGSGQKIAYVMGEERRDKVGGDTDT